MREAVHVLYAYNKWIGIMENDPVVGAMWLRCIAEVICVSDSSTSYCEVVWS